MIYIDPPYNTANGDFVYNDTRIYKLDDLINAGMSEDEAKRVLEFSSKKSSSHSAWLTFMYSRLFLARKLLKDDGVIFISIDDNEASQLKLLCDEIFGEENFICNFSRTTRKGGGSMSKYVSIDHENILMYAKNLNFTERFFIPYDDEYLKRYKEEDSIGKYFWDTFARNRQGSSNNYEIEFPNGVKETNNWIYKKEKFEKLLKEGEIRFFLKSNNKYTVQIKQRIGNSGMIARSELKDYPNSLGTECLSVLLGKEIFSYSKPVELIKYLLQISTDKDDTILDFFAGSGTTGHAVMQLNAEDGGDRKYILVQLDEKIDEKKSKIAYDFVKDELKREPTIYEITRERLLRAAKKIKHDYANATNLEFSEFSIVPKDELELEKLEKLDLSLSDDLFINFDESKTNEILTSYKLADGIALDVEFKTVFLNEYKAYYSNKLLYLVYPYFTSENTKVLMQKLQNKDLICERVILYNASFKSSEHKTLKDALNQIGVKLQVRF